MKYKIIERTRDNGKHQFIVKRQFIFLGLNIWLDVIWLDNAIFKDSFLSIDQAEEWIKNQNSEKWTRNKLASGKTVKIIDV